MAVVAVVAHGRRWGSPGRHRTAGGVTEARRLLHHVSAKDVLINRKSPIRMQRGKQHVCSRRPIDAAPR